MKWVSESPAQRFSKWLLEQMGWKAEETLFLDDSKVNIDAAQTLGIQTWWIETPKVFSRSGKKNIRLLISSKIEHRDKEGTETIH